MIPINRLNGIVKKDFYTLLDNIDIQTRLQWVADSMRDVLRASKAKNKSLDTKIPEAKIEAVRTAHIALGEIFKAYEVQTKQLLTAEMLNLDLYTQKKDLEEQVVRLKQENENLKRNIR